MVLLDMVALVGGMILVVGMGVVEVVVMVGGLVLVDGLVMVDGLELVDVVVVVGGVILVLVDLVLVDGLGLGATTLWSLVWGVVVMGLWICLNGFLVTWRWMVGGGVGRSG